MRLTALDTFDNRKEGDQFDAPEHHARQLIAKGLAKAGPVPQNKMAPPSENKAAPTPAVGTARTSSALPAAPVSAPPIAKPVATGRRRGRPPIKK